MGSFLVGEKLYTAPILSSNRIAVYTAVFNDYDRLHNFKRDPQCDYICFTDNAALRSDLFEIKQVPRKFDHPARDARFYKVLSHAVLPNYKRTVWMDASAAPRFSNTTQFVDAALRDKCIAFHRHPSNDDVYNEVERCIQYQKDDPQLMRRQVARYQADGFPALSGLVASGVIVRDMGDARLPALERGWWREIAEGSFRDQLSFNYVAWKQAIEYSTFDTLRYVPGGNPEFVSAYFEFWLHASSRP